MSHQAVIVELKDVRPHSNADRLQLATVLGYQIVVGLDAKDGDRGVFFYPELQLSEQYAIANDLIERRNEETGEREGGFFSANRRVRSQKFRGEKSEGYFAHLDSLNIAGVSVATITKLAVGETFDNLDGIDICNKYYTPATLRQMNNVKKLTRANKYFAKHVETEKLQFCLDSIPDGTICYITEKLHGTSARYGRVLETRELPRTFKDKVLRRKAQKVSKYQLLIGTRNMILGQSDKPSFYGKEEFRYNVVESFKNLLSKGEVVYGEIVGYTTTGNAIMGQHDTSALKDLKKRYGAKMEYSYGIAPGFCEFYVYRITRVNEDGDVVELSWPQVKRRAAQLGLKTVPQIYIKVPITFFKETKESFWTAIEGILEGPSTLSSDHIREGVVVRAEKPDGTTEFYKAKSFTFGVLEGYIKQQDDYIDAEEVS